MSFIPVPTDLCLFFTQWLEKASVTDMYTYYIGGSLTDNIMTLDLKKITWKQALAGKVYLVRKRNEKNRMNFDYIAIKAGSHPVQRLVPFNDEQLKQKYKYLAGKGRYHGEEIYI